MAVLTLLQLKTLFQSLTAEMTGLDEDRGVRNTYPPTGQPAWKIDENVAFVSIQPIDNLYDKLRDITYGQQTPVTGEEIVSDYATSYTRVMAVDWVIYGPDSFDLADLIRYKLLSDDTMATLRDNKIAPITDIDAPHRLTELFVGQWWERSDLRCLFNVLTTRTKSVPYLQYAEVQVWTEQGLQEIINIEEP